MILLSLKVFFITNIFRFNKGRRKIKLIICTLQYVTQRRSIKILPQVYASNYITRRASACYIIWFFNRICIITEIWKKRPVTCLPKQYIFFNNIKLTISRNLVNQNIIISIMDINEEVKLEYSQRKLLEEALISSNNSQKKYQ